LPVTLLTGFLGAGKTTTLKHILEQKHGDVGSGVFRCAVIVNDMAALNIDKSLIASSTVVQSDEVIAMQNGCICCNLQSDLVEQVVKIAESKNFDYMIIEASGVSEPGEIAPLFLDCEDEHDHDEEHGDKSQLGDVARLDSAVTVVDADQFNANLDSVRSGPAKNLSELMMEQIEYCSIILLNKTDLVSPPQLETIKERINALNPSAKVLTCQYGRAPVASLLNTHSFDAENFEQGAVVFAALHAKGAQIWQEPECCLESKAQGKAACCAPDEGDTIKTSLSEVYLYSRRSGTQLTRHESRFGMTSFIYRARRPFHPERLGELFLDQFFLVNEEVDSPEQLQSAQQVAARRGRRRNTILGGLVRSKGFIWVASTNNVLGSWSQAGNSGCIQGEQEWLCLAPEMWEDTPGADDIRADFQEPYGDRRQEIVFIGSELKYNIIQEILDEALLTDAEFAQGPEGWATMEDIEKYRLTLEESDDEQDGDGDDGEEEADEMDES